MSPTEPTVSPVAEFFASTPGRVAGIAGGTLTVSLLTSWLLRKRMMEALGKARRVKKQELEQLAKGVGAPRGTPVVAHKGPLTDGNAFYVRSTHLPMLAVEDPKGYDKLRDALRTAQKKGHRPKGVIMYDPRLGRHAVLAHESGHAAIDVKGGLPEMNQRFIRPWFPAVAGIAASIGANVTGRNMARDIQSTPLAALTAGGAGTLFGALAGAPVILNEYDASSRALKYLESTGKFSPAAMEKERKALRNALHTYMGGAMIAPAAVGAISALLTKNHDNLLEAKTKAPDLAAAVSAG